MSKKRLKPEDRKVKFSISIDPELYHKIDKLHPNKSKFIEWLICQNLIKTKVINENFI